MNYKLAKQLKDAGFEHEGLKDMELHDTKLLKVDWEMYKTSYAPTLEELIDACGDSFNSLENPVGDEWFAEAKENEEKDYCKSCGTRTVEPIMKAGKTPIEAVAKLWLALKKK